MNRRENFILKNEYDDDLLQELYSFFKTSFFLRNYH